MLPDPYFVLSLTSKPDSFWYGGAVFWVAGFTLKLESSAYVWDDFALVIHLDAGYFRFVMIIFSPWSGFVFFYAENQSVLNLNFILNFTSDVTC